MVELHVTILLLGVMIRYVWPIRWTMILRKDKESENEIQKKKKKGKGKWKR